MHDLPTEHWRDVARKLDAGRTPDGSQPRAVVRLLEYAQHASYACTSLRTEIGVSETSPNIPYATAHAEDDVQSARR